MPRKGDNEYRDEDEPYEDSYEKAEKEARDEPPSIPFGNVFAQVIGVPQEDPRQAKAVREVEKRLGGLGVAALVDALKTGLMERYEPLFFTDLIREFQKDVGTDLWNQLVGTENLKWAINQWDSGRLIKALNWAIDEADRRINVGDDVSLSRHEVEMWLRAAICFCGRCWKT